MALHDGGDIVFHTHRRALDAAVAIALTLAAVTAAITRSDDVSARGAGLDWSSAGIGAAAVASAFAFAFAALAGLRYRRVGRPTLDA